MSNNITIPIILLHGLGGFIGPDFTALSLKPMKSYLEFNNYINVYIVKYPSDESSIDESLEHVDGELTKLVDKDTEEIIVIGQSMGGVIAFNLHTKGWNIKRSISIGSPLHGARLITQVEGGLKDGIQKTYDKTGNMYNYLKDMLHYPGYSDGVITQIDNKVRELQELIGDSDDAYNYLQRKIKCPGHIALQNKERQEEPPHDYKTISMSWVGFKDFDGCVYKDEAVINPEKNLHLDWADHRTIFLNPKLWIHVRNIIKD